MKSNLANGSEIESIIGGIQQVPVEARRRIVELIDALGAIPDSARPLSARLLSELSQLIRHDGQAHYDIIDLMIPYLKLQSAAIQQDAHLPTAPADSLQQIET